MRVSLPFAPLTAAWRRFTAQDPPVLLLSSAIQLAIGLLFGHVYDARIFMATGYLVGTGQNPYIPQDLTAIFNHAAFQGMTTIGYPPPWALILGFLYRISYGIFPNLLVYNLVIKIPIILANLGVAILAARILRELGTEAAVARKAWVFLLFNPFVLYCSAAWGQFDSIVALLCLASLMLLNSGKIKSSALLLALAICLKPIALPVLPVVWFYLMGKSWRQAFLYAITCFAGAILCCVAPFIVLGWDPTPIFKGWNAQFTVAGGMSYLTFFELLKDSYQLPGQWWLLGLAWIPVLAIGAFALKSRQWDFVELLRKCTALILIFYLTRTWLSEPNILLLLPFVVILTAIGELSPIFLSAVWILPLIFTIFNTSPPQLLFLNFPDAMNALLKLSDEFRSARLAGRTLVVLPWLVAGWWMMIVCFRKRSSCK